MHIGSSRFSRSSHSALYLQKDPHGDPRHTRLVNLPSILQCSDNSLSLSQKIAREKKIKSTAEQVAGVKRKIKKKSRIQAVCSKERETTFPYLPNGAAWRASARGAKRTERVKQRRL